MESPGIGSSQATVLEDAQALDFSDVSKNLWELKISVEEITAKKSLEIPDVAFCAALLVCLSKSLDLLKIYFGSEIGVFGGPLGLWKLNPGVRTITLTTISNYTCKLLTKGD